MKGKDKCELLKDMRRQIAKACKIEYEPKSCDFEGDCSGYCPVCDSESKWLLEEIRRKGYADKEICVYSDYGETDNKLEQYHPEGRRKMNQIFKEVQIVPSFMLGVVEFIDPYENIEEDNEDIYDEEAEEE